jgi:ligand-binding sensor domain-containing protein/signal transduction histidine kinase
MKRVKPVVNQLFCAAVLLLFLPCLILAEQLPIKIYTTSNGLVSNKISRIVRDSRGYLWFCTQQGLSRFDGYRFTNYTMDEGLPDNEVNDLLETRNGDFWVATGKGLCRFYPSGGVSPAQLRITEGRESRPHAQARFVVYRPGEGRRASAIKTIYEDKSGRLWCGTWQGLYQVELTNQEVNFRLVKLGIPLDEAKSYVVRTPLEDRKGALWIPTDYGLYRLFGDGRVEHFTKRHGLFSDKLMGIIEDQEGKLWVGDRLGGLCQLVSEPDVTRPIVAHYYTSKDGLECLSLTFLFASSDGRLWVGTDCGVSEFLPQKNRFNQRIKTYLGGESLTDPRVWWMAEDSADNLWIGSADGAIQLLRGGLTTYTEADGLDARGVVSINESKTGELFVHTRSSRQDIFNRFEGQRFTPIKPNLPKAIRLTEWLIGLQDREKKWWVITPQEIWTFPEVNKLEELARRRPKPFYRAPVDGPISAFEDRHGDIWFSSRVEMRLMRWERATAKSFPYTEEQGLPSGGDFAWAYAEDREGNLWVCFENLGLARYVNGRFKAFALEEGIPVSGVFFFDSKGRLWIARGAEGLICIDNPTAENLQVSRYTIANGLSSHDVWCITEDQWGRLYIGTTRGLDRLDLATGSIKHFTTADGLANIQVNKSFRDRQGVLWFGTDTGLSRLIPEPEMPKSPPAIFINRVNIPNRDYHVSEMGETRVRGLELEANQNHIQIDFVSLEFGAGEVLKYQYQLLGADADWQPLTTQRSVNYANLAPGAYHFSVRAVNSEGRFSPTPASFEFIILAPVWQRWWFLALVAVATILAVNAMYRYRLTQRLEVERMRIRIAADLHDDIGANLTKIGILSEVANSQINGTNHFIGEPISSIARISRESVASMSDIVWAINPKRDSLRDLVRHMREFAGEIFANCDIEFDFRAPSSDIHLKLGADARRTVYLIFKEAVNNIVRHADCQKADLELRIEAAHLVLQVSDDGRGFDSGQESEGNGLLSMHRRAALAGGTLEVVSLPPSGTSITLRLPVKSSKLKVTNQEARTSH